MFNKFAAPKCASGYARNEKKQIAKFHFSLKNASYGGSGFVLSIEEIGLQRNTWSCLNYILKTNIYGEVKNSAVVDESCTHCLSQKPFK